MKIAITGHSAGIGEALASIYTSTGHEVIGLSRRNGYNIRSTPKVASMIEPCDIFINNAQAGFAQTELLFEVWRRWQGLSKQIIVISTMMTSLTNPPLDEWDEYWLQKKTLEEGCRQLRTKSKFPMITLVKPGEVATQDGQYQPKYADVNIWASGLINCFNTVQPELMITEIALVPFYGL